MNEWALVWFVLMVVCLIIEGETVSLVSIWFAAGALAALILSLFPVSPVVQIVAFFLVGGILLSALRPLAKKHFSPKLTATNVDAIPGRTATVLTEIDNLAETGQIKLGGLEWTARSTSGQPISSGTIVVVDRVEGVKAFVSPAKSKN